MGFFKDDKDRTRPITKPTSEIKRKKIVKKPRNFKGVSPTKKLRRKLRDRGLKELRAQPIGVMNRFLVKRRYQPTSSGKVYYKDLQTRKAIDDLDWSARLKERSESYLKRFPELKPLKKKLLAIGGDFVVLLPDPDLKKILKRGRMFKPSKIQMLNMASSRCHSNVSEIWSGDGTKKMKIVTGWALSDDGLWRQHSWLLRGKTLLETTVPRDKYFGFVLTEKEAEKFFFDNW